MGRSTCADEVSVPEIVARGLDRVHVSQRRAMRMCDVPGSRGEALARLGELYRREARWWDVLANWVYSPRGDATSLVFGRAVIAAHRSALEFARHYDEHAASARRRAALDPALGVVA